MGTEECPVSAVQAQSWTFIEEFALWKLTGTGYGADSPARSLDAMQVLEREWQKEIEHARRSVEE